MRSKRRQVILAALILALGSAVYLNWQFSENKDLTATDILGSAKELGQAQFVNNTPANDSNSKNKNEENNNKEDDSNIQNNDDKSSDYFSKAKSARQKARDEATDTIKEILDDAKSSEETKSEAVKQAALIAKIIEQEANIENLIKAKGFAECLTFIQNDECSVVIKGEPLNEALAISIKDIICSQSGISPDKIKIVEANN